MSNILVIDDDRALGRSIQLQLKLAGHHAEICHDATDGLAAAPGPHDLILLDLNLAGKSGIDLLRALRQDGIETPVAMITGEQDMAATIEAVRLGAVEYLRKPLLIDDVLAVIAKLNESSTAAETIPVQLMSANPREIVGTDKKVIAMLKQIAVLSQSSVSVLIDGESGSGKEFVARALHDVATPDKPFVAINCTALVANLLESELFGHEKGAFTGAERRKEGMLELASDGTLFLDEIGDMPVELQAKLLRVLQEREFQRVGGTTMIPFRARVVAATHRQLTELIAAGTFREDLYYRLNVTSINVPALRERRTDVGLLTQHLLARIASILGREVTAIEVPAVARLKAHEWPGNIRELENVLTRAVALAKTPIIRESDITDALSGSTSPSLSDGEIAPLSDVVREHVEAALIAHAWNITHTAKALNISPTTLRKKIADFAICR